MENNKKTRREFLKLFGSSVFSLFFGCNSARYFNLRKKCGDSEINQNKIRIMSFNIANARGNNDNFFDTQPIEKIEYGLNWIAEIIRNYNIDVACFNEMDFNSIRTNNIDMAERIANNVCYNHVITEKMFSFPSVLELGNAVVSRYPLRLKLYHQYGYELFDQAKNAFKSFVDFEVLLGGKKLNIIQTHLDNQREEVRCAQAQTLRNYLRNKKNPFVLLGDFNSTPDGRCFEYFTNNNLVNNPHLELLTYPSDIPRVQIDYILTSPGLRIDNYHTVHIKISDHLPVIGDITID